MNTDGEPDTQRVDPAQCPLCGSANACGIAAGQSTCWCFDVAIPADVKASVPAAARDVTCICASCAEGRREPS